jgi:prophage DNA circulation protein
MIELPGENGRLRLAAQEMARAHAAQASIQQFIAETASRIYAHLAAHVAAELQSDSKLYADRMRAAAAAARDAAPYLAEALGLCTVNREPEE